jgi:glycosyltransferase involved in cell wall biosynthesis
LITIADVNVALTRESASLLERFCGISRAAYLPNFIDDRHIQLSSVEAREKGSESRRVRAAYVGELSTDKGTLDLLQAARALPHVDFVLMGEISPGIREAVGSAPANVRATGVRTRAAVMASLRDADLFVFPSRREGFPNAVLEAMASGLPVVSTRVGAIPEMVQDSLGGYLVAPSDPNALTAAIGRLAEDRVLSRQMGEHNRNVCSEKFGFDAVFPRLTAIYEQIVSSGPDRRSDPPLLRPLSGAATVSAQRGEEADR